MIVCPRDEEYVALQKVSTVAKAVDRRMNGMIEAVVNSIWNATSSPSLV